VCRGEFGSGTEAAFDRAVHVALPAQARVFAGKKQSREGLRQPSAQYGIEVAFEHGIGAAGPWVGLPARLHGAKNRFVAVAKPGQRSRQLLNATLGGDFRVAKTAGKPTVLLGAVNTVRGTYAYQGRRFDLVRDGQILFRGSEEIDPRLDITAERTIQGVEARVRIQGTARKPELSLSSTPPLDEGDILALIVFNQPLNQLGTGQQNSLAQRAGGIAAGFVMSPLAEALGSTLDLDQFEVETTDPTGRVNPAVVIGQQVTQDMFLRFRQQFGNQQVTQFLLEYRLADFLRLQGNVAEGDGLTAGNRSLTQRIERYGMDLVFYFSF